MEVIQEMDLRKTRNTEKQELFQRIEGVSFCKGCGKQYREKELDNVCLECSSSSFIKGKFAETLAGYLKLDREGTLKKYYDTRYRKSSVIRMNNRRMILWLLTKDGYILPNSKWIEDVITQNRNMRNCDGL